MSSRVESGERETELHIEWLYYVKIGVQQIHILTVLFGGRAVVQTVSRQPLTADARPRVQVTAYEVCGEQSVAVTRFSPSPSISACNHDSTAAPYSLVHYMEDAQRAR